MVLPYVPLQQVVDSLDVKNYAILCAPYIGVNRAIGQHSTEKLEPSFGSLSRFEAIILHMTLFCHPSFLKSMVSKLDQTPDVIWGWEFSPLPKDIKTELDNRCEYLSGCSD